jgi:nucleotide-binding universal stress UspA family protein
MYTHILIPTDGSERSRRAITTGMNLAAALRAKVIVLTATPAIPLVALEGLVAPVHNEELEQNATDYAKKCVDVGARLQLPPAPAARRYTRSTISPGRRSLRPLSGRAASDLIVMASHGRAGAGAILLGSETIKLLTQSKIPVLICH